MDPQRKKAYDAFRDLIQEDKIAALMKTPETQSPSVRDFCLSNPVYLRILLEHAAGTQNADCLKWVLSLGLRLEHCDLQRDEAPHMLLRAIDAENMEFFDWMRDFGTADDDFRGWRRGVFKHAATRGRMKVVEWYKTRGLSRIEPDMWQLMVEAAALVGKIEVLTWLEQFTPNEPSLAGLRYARMWAAVHGHTCVLKWLQKYIPTFDDSDVCQILHLHAVYAVPSSSVERLLQSLESLCTITAAQCRYNDNEVLRIASAMGHTVLLEWLARRLTAAEFTAVNQSDVWRRVQSRIRMSLLTLLLSDRRRGVRRLPAEVWEQEVAPLLG